MAYKLFIKKYSLFILLFFLVSISNAQKTPIKFGKPDDADLKMTIYPQDSTAHAVVICDYGRSHFQYSTTGEKGWQIFFKRILRIKILDKGGVSEGDIRIKLYHDGVDKEKLSDLEGNTFNIEDGKVVKTKLEKSNVMTEEFDKNHDIVKFAMPNVKEGSVIDIEYTIISDFLFNLQTWYFQQDIPVKWSEYFVQIPEYFIYNHSLMGYNPLVINEKNSATNSILFNPGSGGSLSDSKVDYTIYEYRLAMQNVPAFIEESYLASAGNYLSKYSFELASTKSQGNVFKDYTNTWTKINELLLNSEDFGTAGKRAGFISDEIKIATSGYNDSIGKMLAVYEMIRKNVRWNGRNSAFAKDTKKAWKDRSGNSADINLLLTAALRSVDLDAVPVVLSTRSNGMLNPFHPSLSDLDYVICQVKAGGKVYLLDATERLSPTGLIPERCLNGKGRIVNSNEGDWVDLSPIQGDVHAAQYRLTLNGDGSIDGKASHVRDAYNALSNRKKIKAASSEDDYYKEKEKSIPGYTILSHSCVTLDSVNIPLKEEVEFKLTEAMEQSGDLILVSPLLFENTKSNPFKLIERLYPVEFPYPIKETLIFNWQLPEGFVVDQLPKPLIISIPDNAAKFTFNISQVGSTITILSKIQINKTMYISEEYELIKEFFNQIISKQGEQIILKKS